MFALTRDYIRRQVADSEIIYQRGVRIYEHGVYACVDADEDKGAFVYEIDGNYGDYSARIRFSENNVEYACNCPYPGKGCKHAVAVLLDLNDRMALRQHAACEPIEIMEPPPSAYLTEAEIRAQAVADRKKRADQEQFNVTRGDTIKGEHLVETPKGRQYTVTLHDADKDQGHCTCPDFATNRLGICKHIFCVAKTLKKQKGYKKQQAQSVFPFVDIFWDSTSDRPKIFNERPAFEIEHIKKPLSEYFDPDGLFNRSELSDLLSLLPHIQSDKRVRIDETVLTRLDDHLQARQLENLAESQPSCLDMIRAQLYPYQQAGVQFALYRKAALIGDEMGLGKTLQAIAAGILKKEIFGFNKILVVTIASLKEQWKREIERFTHEKAVVIAGSATARRTAYHQQDSLFKITNYEAVLRDVTLLRGFKPDLVILDEAQRIKNFTTKTAEAVKSIPRKHAMVLTGTPLESKLEDVYSIVQFLDPNLLSPLWKFAADHFMLSRASKGKIIGYRNLDALHEKLKSIVIRRKKAEVLSDLPDEVVNNYYLDLTCEQQSIHSGCARRLLHLFNKKFITPVDLRRIQELLLKMRMVCDSTFLIDRQTHISPKLRELEGILDELVVQSQRKVVIFSEWTTMTFLIAKRLSDAGIDFVELSGKVPVKKRQTLIDEFTHNPKCMVFLSTDAGGTGLNLQAADCVINFELPWNPARMNQRIGRVNRIGQKSRSVNVVNLICKDSIEEKILAGLQLKTDLFQGVFDGGVDMVEFSREKRTEMLNRLREMMGEEPEIICAETRPPEEIPEDTPHYLNPQLLKQGEETVAYDAEETTEETRETESEAGPEVRDESGASENILQSQSPEKIESVLDSGMKFIGGLLEMATGQKIQSATDDGRMIQIDRKTGEVTLKFRLPGF